MKIIGKIMFLTKYLKKKKIVLPKIKKVLPTLEEVGKTKKADEVPYFRVLDNKLVLYLKTAIGVKEKNFELPLTCTNIQFISTKVGGNKKFWENEIVIALNRHWEKYNA